MRKITDEDLAKIKGNTINGYHVEAVKIKRGPFIDSDHYGIILGKSSKEKYVTWEFHLMNDESVSVYWGHYIMDREEALRDFRNRGADVPQKFHVIVTETFQLTDWRRGEFTLGPECFAGVEFEVKRAEN